MSSLAVLNCPCIIHSCTGIAYSGAAATLRLQIEPPHTKACASHQIRTHTSANRHAGVRSSKIAPLTRSQTVWSWIFKQRFAARHHTAGFSISKWRNAAACALSPSCKVVCQWRAFDRVSRFCRLYMAWHITEAHAHKFRTTNHFRFFFHARTRPLLLHRMPMSHCNKRILSSLFLPIMLH